jgi:selenocysteine-specific elongation factor
VVALTKSDLVEPDIVDLVRLEVEDLTAGSFLEGKPIVAVSSATGSGLDELRRAIVQSVSEVDDRDAESRVFRLPIDRVFSMKGFGSVITGTTFSGRVEVESEVEVLPGGDRSRARAIQVHNETRSFASAGERTSMNLPDIELDRLHRGQQVVTPGTLRASQIITARLSLLDDSKPLKDQTRIRFHHLASELLGSIRFVDETTELKGGMDAFVQVRLESPVVAVAGDRFVIRRYSPSITIGGGVILDAHLPKLSRNTRPELLETLSMGSLQRRVELMAKLEGIRGITLRELQVRTGIGVESLPRDFALTEIATHRWIHPDVITDFRRRGIDIQDRDLKEKKMSEKVPKG